MSEVMPSQGFVTSSGGGDGAPSTPSGDSAPTGGEVAGGTETQHGSAPAPGGAANDNAAPATEGEATGQPTPEMYKLTRGGKEMEVSVEQMRSMLSDDYDHAVTANGEERHAKWGDIVRGYQLSTGAMAKMQEAADIRKNFLTQREEGRTDDASRARYIEEHLLDEGMTTDDWAMQLLRSRFEEDKRINALRQNGQHREADEAIAHRERQKLERQQGLKDARAQRDAEQKAQAEERRRFAESIPRALEAAGMPYTPATHALLARVMRQHEAVGYELPVEDAAHMARDAYTQEMRSHVGSMAPDALAGFLGDDMRKALREYELAALKPAAPPEKPEPKPQADPPPGGGKPRRGALGERRRLRDVSR